MFKFSDSTGAYAELSRRNKSMSSFVSNPSSYFHIFSGMIIFKGQISL